MALFLGVWCTALPRMPAAEMARRKKTGENKMDEEGGRGGDRPMYDAVCSKCGQPCKVPFKPASDRPVYCRDCYRPKRRF